MSVVTDFVVFTSVLDEDSIPMKKLGFEEVSGQCGGSRALQCGLWTAAFNVYEIGDIYKGLRSIAWREPELVQIFVKNEWEDKFKKVNIRKGGKQMDDGNTRDSESDSKRVVLKSDGHVA